MNGCFNCNLLLHEESSPQTIHVPHRSHYGKRTKFVLPLPPTYSNRYPSGCYLRLMCRDLPNSRRTSSHIGKRSSVLSYKTRPLCILTGATPSIFVRSVQQGVLIDLKDHHSATVRGVLHWREPHRQQRFLLPLHQCRSHA